MMTEESFEERVFDMYNKWMFVDVFIADGGVMACVFVLITSGLWQIIPFIVIPCAYMLTLGAPSRPIMHFMKNYMDVGEPQYVDKLFMKKVEPRFGGFGLWYPWKDFDAVFV